MALDELLDASKWQYFAGPDTTGSPTWTRKLEDASQIDGGGGSTAWVPYLNAYLSIAQTPGDATRHDDVFYQVARYPWGPWSRPEMLFQGVRHTGNASFGDYGATLHPEFARGDGSTQYITYVVAGALTGSLQLAKVTFAAPSSQWHASANTEAYFGRRGERLDIATGGASISGDPDAASGEAFAALYRRRAAPAHSTVSVRVDGQPSASPGASAGLVVRNDFGRPTARSGFVALVAKAGIGVELLWDADDDGTLDQRQTVRADTTAPVWLRLHRFKLGGAKVYVGQFSHDGRTWSVVNGTPLRLGSAAEDQDAGVARFVRPRRQPDPPVSFRSFSTVTPRAIPRH